MARSLDEIFLQLTNIPWFSNCGIVFDDSATQVRSWAEAERYLAPSKAVNWENFKLAISNRHREVYHETFLEKIKGLNDSEAQKVYEQKQKIARANAAAVEQFITLNSARILTTAIDHPELERMLKLDIGWIVGDLLNPVPGLAFFGERLFPIYAAGHLPCGWSGKKISRNWNGASLADLPKGQIVVF